MKPIGTVIALAVEDLNRALAFYQDGLDMTTPGIDDGIITLELPNLSLFLIERVRFETYTSDAQVTPHRAHDSVECIVSCALTTKDEVDDVLKRVAAAGGTVPHPAQNGESGYTGYFRDPDGHLWELVASGEL